MGVIKESIRGTCRRAIPLLSVALAFTLILIAVQMMAAADDEAAAGDMAGSYKLVDKNQAVAGSTLQYSIVISNNGGPLAGVLVTDTLPLSMTYQTASLQSPPELNVTTFGIGESNGVISWTGALGAQAFATISFRATLTDTVQPGQVVTNTVEITGSGALILRSAPTLVVSEPPTRTIYFPVFFKSPPKPLLQVTRPNSSNAWNVSWTVSDGTGISGYELHESQSPDFSTHVSYTLASAALSQPFTHAASFKNTYYYRVRAIVGSIDGPWSDTVSVVGGYRDDFNDRSSGWAIRRTTFLEEIATWYEPLSGVPDWLILRVEDSWDWGLASPMAKAPTLPYAIEYRSQVANLGNLVSHGAAFGGDWPGSICPDYSSVIGVYAHDLCFNHFYNTNTIWYANLKLLFERVDYLYYCPSCGGSPLKRLSHDYGTWFQVDPIPNISPAGWNTWRIEVRSNGIRLYANGQFYASSGDTTWVNEPYFGVFGSADEYSNSTTRFDYFQVMPLDS
jgi:uncharacterized repeat protein (TIGR01451 family)